MSAGLAQGTLGQIQTEISHCTCPQHTQHYYRKSHQRQSQKTHNNLNTQGSQILLNKPYLMLINIKAGQNLLWFKLALCSRKTLEKPGRTSDWATGAGKSVWICERLWYHMVMENSPHQSRVVGNGSQPANHTVVSHAFCLFYEKEVLPTGFRSKFILIGKERKSI